MFVVVGARGPSCTRIGVPRMRVGQSRRPKRWRGSCELNLCDRW